MFDENKNEIFKKDIVMLCSETGYYGNLKLTTSVVLTPCDNYAMYLMGLDELMKE